MKQSTRYLLICILLSTFFLSACRKEFPKPLLTVASFTYVMHTPNAPCIVSFTNTSQNATSYSWDLGDGSSSDSVNFSHTYSQKGSYIVKLTATGSRGKTFYSQTITIGASIPESAFIFEMNQQNAPVVVRFTNLSKNADSYQWDFGDNAFSSQSNPIHVYTLTGVFNITLIASGVDGTDTSTQLIYIAPPYTMAYIKKVTILNFPFINPSTATTWDNGSGPDVYFKINSIYGELYSLPIADRINDVTPEMLPISWDFPAPYWQVPNLTTTVFIELYDYDIPGPDQSINWGSGFMLGDYPSFPLSITKTWMNYTVKLDIQWY